MKTTSLYHSFAMQHEELSKEIVKRVKGVVALERLYLLGLTTAYRRTETLFSTQSATRSEVTHYYLLVLVEKEDDHTLNNIQDKIETNLQQYLPVTAIVFSNMQFTKWLLEGHPFAASVYERALLLHQEDEMPLPFPFTANKEVRDDENELLLRQTRIRVKEFLAGAELFTIRLQFRMAAFMLHQAAEQALRTMLIIRTGLRINSHSIDRLIRCCSMFCFELIDVFPRRSEKEKRHFQLLQKAYIDARYSEDYRIKLEELVVITTKVKTLISICNNRMRLQVQ